MKEKTLIIIAFLLLSFGVKSQNNGLYLKDSAISVTGHIDTSFHITWLASHEKIKSDTIKCIMLASDTCLQYYGNYDCGNCPHSGYNSLVYWQIGYCYNTDSWHINWEYLDADKKPLSKNIIVWQAKKLN